MSGKKQFKQFAVVLWGLLVGLLMFGCDSKEEDRDSASHDVAPYDGPVQLFVLQVDAADVAQQNFNLADIQKATVEVLDDRLRSMRIKDADVRAEEDGRIVVRVPLLDAATSAEVRALLANRGELVFKLVDLNNDQYVGDLLTTKSAPEGFTLGDGYYVRDKAALPDEKLTPEYFETLRDYGDYPSDLMLQRDHLHDGIEIYRPIFVETSVLMTGANIRAARANKDRMTGGNVVELSFNREGTKEFAEITQTYSAKVDQPRRRIAIILDDTLCSAPVLMGSILNGRAVISGAFTMEEVRLIEDVLNAGAYPASLTLVEERQEM